MTRTGRVRKEECMKQIELLSPAGSYEGFMAAVSSGADAVYAGGPAFGARAYAVNFSREELIQAIRTAHVHGKKLYMTVNTLMREQEMTGQLYEFLVPYYEAGLDAVLVQDFGVLSFIREYFPDLPVHASTQMTVTGPEGMRFLKEKGLVRVVPARELSLAEIQVMHETCPDMEIETFIHGALCYCYSGRCLMSSMLGGRSGNRGRCAQPCRLPYQAEIQKQKSGTASLLSLKDLNTLEILPDILEAGVVSLKIEGRMKKPSYTAGVTSIYRKYLDLYLEKGREAYCPDKTDRQILRDLFSRGGSCDGYYRAEKGPFMMDFHNDKKTGEVEDILPPAITLGIDGILKLIPGEKACLCVKGPDLSVDVYGSAVQAAVKQPMDEARVRAQMEKMGGTDFYWKSLRIIIKGDIFIPVRELNELRRSAVEKIFDQLAGRFHRKRILPDIYDRSAGQPLANPDTSESASLGASADAGSISAAAPLYVSCESSDILKELIREPDIDGFYLPMNLILQHQDLLRTSGKAYYLAFPAITRGSVPEKYLEKAAALLEEGLSGFLVSDLESFSILKRRGLQACVILDSSMYVWNKRAVSFWKEEGIRRFTLPLELNEKDLRKIASDACELIVYGRAPLMISAQCINKNVFHCTKKEEPLRLKDRKKTVFPVKNYCQPWKPENTAGGNSCYNIIYNSVPTSLLSEYQAAAGLGCGAFRLCFTTETPGEAVSVCREFAAVYRRGCRPAPESDFTRGHFKRGAE